MLFDYISRIVCVVCAVFSCLLAAMASSGSPVLKNHLDNVISVIVFPKYVVHQVKNNVQSSYFLH